MTLCILTHNSAANIYRKFLNFVCDSVGSTVIQCTPLIRSKCDRYLFILIKLRILLNCHITCNSETKESTRFQVIFVINDLLANVQNAHVIKIPFFYLHAERQLTHYNKSGLSQKFIFCYN